MQTVRFDRIEAHHLPNQLSQQPGIVGGRHGQLRLNRQRSRRKLQKPPQAIPGVVRLVVIEVAAEFPGEGRQSEIAEITKPVKDIIPCSGTGIVIGYHRMPDIGKLQFHTHRKKSAVDIFAEPVEDHVSRAVGVKRFGGLNSPGHYIQQIVPLGIKVTDQLTEKLLQRFPLIVEHAQGGHGRDRVLVESGRLAEMVQVKTELLAKLLFSLIDQHLSNQQTQIVLYEALGLRLSQEFGY